MDAWHAAARCGRPDLMKARSACSNLNQKHAHLATKYPNSHRWMLCTDLHVRTAVFGPALSKRSWNLFNSIRNCGALAPQSRKVRRPTARSSYEQVVCKQRSGLRLAAGRSAAQPPELPSTSKARSRWHTPGSPGTWCEERTPQPL